MSQGPRRMGPAHGGFERSKDFGGTLKKLLGSIGKYKIGLLFVALCSIAGTIFTIVGPKILSKATTALFEGLVAKVSGTGGIDFSKIVQILTTLLVIYVVSSLFSYFQGLIMAGISQKVALSFRNSISEKIHRLPMKYFESTPVGDVLSRITNDVDTLGQNLNQSVNVLITSVATILGVLYMMLSINVIMTLVVLVILPVSLGLIRLIMKKSNHFFQANQKHLGAINGQIEETFSAQTVVQAFNREQDSIKDFDVTNKKLFEASWKSQFFSGIMQPVMFFVGNLGYVGVAMVGSLLAVRGVITVGDIQAFIQYVRSFTQPITQTAQVTNMLQSMAAAAERVFEFLEEPEQTPDQNQAGFESPIKGQVAFEHVRFGYNPEKTVIKDFTLHVKPGQTVAIVGPTGAGKTTIVKLLMRFYDVDSGRILIDGQNIKEMPREEVRKWFGMVLQDTWLFKGTVMDNIRYGRLDATDEEVIQAAKTAHAHRFIKTLPEGYQMEINEEMSNLSQGQKQLLTIARAVLADKPILILDEATSNVDTRTEVRIQKAMHALMEGRTNFVIAHRLSTIRNADVILAINDGDIVEQGSHEELMAKNGYYAALYTSQFDKVSNQ